MKPWILQKSFLRIQHNNSNEFSTGRSISENTSFVKIRHYIFLMFLLRFYELRKYVNKTEKIPNPFVQQNN